MDSDIKRRLAKAANELGGASSHISTSVPKRSGRKRAGFLWLLVALAVVGVGAYFVLENFKKSTPQKTSPVPVIVQRSVSFPVYYPDPSKLPTGYILDQTSFSGNNQAVVYSVNYDADKKIAFTVQNKPSEDELKTFHANQLPLRHEVPLPIGTAAIGVLNNQTLVSLPTNGTSWLIVAAPLDIDQDHLKQILQALREN